MDCGSIRTVKRKQSIGTAATSIEANGLPEPSDVPALPTRAIEGVKGLGSSPKQA